MQLKKDFFKSKYFKIYRVEIKTKKKEALQN